MDTRVRLGAVRQPLGRRAEDIGPTSQRAVAPVAAAQLSTDHHAPSHQATAEIAAALAAVRRLAEPATLVHG